MATDEDELRARWVKNLHSAAADLTVDDAPMGRFAHWRWRAGRRISDMVLGRHLDTAGNYAELDHFDPENIIYMASGWGYLPRILPRREVTQRDVFADYGCGAGRIVYQAARRYRCRRVIGIELSESLASRARENMQRNEHRLRGTDIEIITANAADFEVPDDLTIAYFHHPFGPTVMGAAVAAIAASVARAPRRFRLIYAAPAHPEIVLATGMFERVRVRHTSLSRSRLTRIELYEHQP